VKHCSASPVFASNPDPSQASNHADSDSATTTATDDGSGEIQEWRQGRRIVELDKLADALRSCIDCGERLHLDRIQSEQ
jgi:hypothetical protein